MVSQKLEESSKYHERVKSFRVDREGRENRSMKEHCVGISTTSREV